MVLLENLTEKEFTLKNMTDEERTSLLNWYRGARRKTAESILPRPVIRDGNGKLIADHTPRDFYLKLQEELFESVDVIFRNAFEWELGKSYTATDDEVAEEIANIITVCISYLNARGYDEKKRSEIFAKVNEKNERRGYFKEG